jgi:glucose-6-phosphate 1-dehydrogenase
MEADQIQGRYLMSVQLKMKQLHASQTQMDKKKKSSPDTFCLMALRIDTDSAPF